MPLLKRKAVEDLIPGKDMLYSKAGNAASPGALVTEPMIQRLARHRVPVVTVIYPSREETTKGMSPGDLEKLVKEKEETEFEVLRGRLFECAKKIFKPFSEKTNRAFWGKLGEKMIKADFLLERRPEVLHRQGIYAGSVSIYGTSGANNQYNDQKAIGDCLEALYSWMEANLVRDQAPEAGLSRVPRLLLDSIRLCAVFDTDLKDRVRILDPGNSFAWHATDTAILTLFALASMSMKRKAQGLPESTEEFEKQKSQVTSHTTISVKADRFHYPRATIIDAALGAFLHGIGLSHLTICRLVSKRPLLDGSPRCQDDIKTIRKSQFVVRNLFEERSDISAITKKVLFQLRQYPDGSGYPFADPAEMPTIPEYSRMAAIANDYDELVNPVLGPHAMCRTETMRLLQKRAGGYRPGVASPRYDKVLLDEFLSVLRPFEAGERVDLFLHGKRGSRYYCGFTRASKDGRALLPEVCVLKNAVAGEAYAYGRVVFDLEGRRVLLLDGEGRPGAAIGCDRRDEKDEKGDFRVKNPKVREMLHHLPDLVILDEMKDAWPVAEYVDPIFGATKPPK